MLMSLIPAILLTAQPTPQELAEQTRAFRAKRESRLRAEDGWLTLVGLDWLDEGANPAGSAADAKIQVPAPCPAHLGTFTREGKKIGFQPAAGIAVAIAGKPFTGGPLKTDADGEPDVLDVAGLHIFAIVRGDRVGLRIKDPNAPARKNFAGIPAWEPDLAWRVVARWEPTPGATIPVPNILGQVEDQPVPGVAIFTIDGKEYRLRPIQEPGDTQLFFIFGDETNKKESYGAGRFLYADAPAEGHVVLDFNRALNPPCAFSHFATCPIPPQGNRLPIRVIAGEKRFGEH
ncbi:MAG: DUF1684 domain-containing protein [Deltaproteobacteria bacterium]|nr:DUF1684 domain-containing protein [Deltaproteobacteria bacterium]